MAVDRVTEVFKSTGTLFESAQKEFEVTFDELTSTVLDALTADDGTTIVPAVGSSYSASFSTYISQRPIGRRIGRSPLFRVIVPYTIQSVQFGGNDSLSPLDRPTEWSSDGVSATLEVDRDAAGNLLLNSAKQVLKTQLQHADKYIRGVKNFATMQNFDAYFSRANSASYTIEGQAYGVETLWLSHITQDFVEEEFDGEILQYWRATFHFYFKIKRGTDEPTKAWRFKVLDRGTIKIDTAAPDGFTPIVGDDSVITAETNLDGSGDVWDKTNIYWLNGATGFATAAVGNDYKQMYQLADFNSLGL